MKITIKDVAQEAEVAISTVSRVLRKQGYYSNETKDKVEKAAEKLNYRVNFIGKSLRSKKSNVLGHISIGISDNPFFGKVTEGIDKIATKKGYHVIVGNTYGNKKLEKEQINMLLERRVDGIILATAISQKNVELLKKENIPVVMIERPLPINGVDKVYIDNKSGVYRAVKYLIECGHRNILYVGVKMKGKLERERLEGFTDAFKDAKIKYQNKNILLTDDYLFEYGKKIIKSYNKKYGLKNISAIFSASETFTMGIMQELYNLNKRIPDDISLISFDDVIASHLAPPITSVAQPIEEMGNIAVKLLIEKINNSNLASKDVSLNTELIYRNSVIKI